MRKSRLGIIGLVIALAASMTLGVARASGHPLGAGPEPGADGWLSLVARSHSLLDRNELAVTLDGAHPSGGCGIARDDLHSGPVQLVSGSPLAPAACQAQRAQEDAGCPFRVPLGGAE